MALVRGAGGVVVGGVTALAFVAVPALFVQLPGPAVAGPVAAWLFGVVSKFSLLAGGALFVFMYFKWPCTQDRRHLGALIFVVLAVLAAALQDAWVAQQIVTARAIGGDLKFWHRLGSVLVLMQWWGAAMALWGLLRKV